MLGYIKSKAIKHKKTVVDFSKYLIIGIIFTFLNISFMWLFIDVIGLYSALGASIVVVGLFFGKFYAYVIVKFLRRHFLGYVTVNITSAVLNVVFVWILIETFRISTVYASSSVVLLLFVARFFAFKKLKLIRE